jgi:hypothetical protein
MASRIAARASTPAYRRARYSRVIEIALVDFVLGHKAVDVDGVVAFDLNSVQLFLFDLDIFALFQFVAAGFLIAFDHVAGLGVDHLLLEPVAGLLVDHMEVGLFDRRRGRVERHRASHEGKFQGPFPIGARGHYNLRIVMRFLVDSGTPTATGCLVPDTCRRARQHRYE